MSRVLAFFCFSPTDFFPQRECGTVYIRDRAVFSRPFTSSLMSQFLILMFSLVLRTYLFIHIELHLSISHYEVVAYEQSVKWYRKIIMRVKNRRLKEKRI